jgi:hypothetical protein
MLTDGLALIISRFDNLPLTLPAVTGLMHLPCTSAPRDGGSSPKIRLDTNQRKNRSALRGAVAALDLARSSEGQQPRNSKARQTTFPEITPETELFAQQLVTRVG